MLLESFNMDDIDVHLMHITIQLHRFSGFLRAKKKLQGSKYSRVGPRLRNTSRGH